MLSQDEILARIKLNAAIPYAADKAHLLIKQYGGACALYKFNAKDLFENNYFTLEAAENFVKNFNSFNAEKELILACKNGISVIIYGEDNYPEMLSKIYDPPLVLYAKGNINNFKQPAIAIVGTRHPSPYGLRMTASLASALAGRGIVVASGLARGVDSAAHSAVVKNNGLTWAVLGTGLINIYPPENKKLAASIIESGGALISEYSLCQTARPVNFPRRNRIISGLSYGVLVIEGNFKSGSLITARCALEQGKEVLALPGQADSKNACGPNHLIKSGAYLVENADDIIACLPEDIRAGIRNKDKTENKKQATIKCLSKEALLVYKAIQAEEKGLMPDEIALKTSLSVAQVSAAVFELEILELITQFAMRYVVK